MKLFIDVICSFLCITFHIFFFLKRLKYLEKVQGLPNRILFQPKLVSTEEGGRSGLPGRVSPGLLGHQVFFFKDLVFEKDFNLISNSVPEPVG